MYVKKEYRGKGYSKILNDAILEEAHALGYTKVYLKTELENYYEKFGAVFIENLPESIKWKDIAWQNVYYGGLSYHSMYKYYHSEEEQKRQDSLLENYYDSYYNSNPTVKVEIDEESKYYYDIDEDYKYLILTQTKYEPQFPNGAYTLSDILSVTKPLYLLQLFETEQFKKLKDEDISFISKLLYLSEKPIERIPIEHLDNLKDLSIYNGYDEIMSKVNETQKILQKIKETKTREI